MSATGRGKRKVLVVAEAPGEEEDRKNVQLIGPAGQVCRKHLQEIGIDIEEDCWKTNAVICRSGGKPTKQQVLACRPNLFKTIRELNPSTIIPMGEVAVGSLIGRLWKENPGSIDRWVGWKIPCQELNAWICPTYHPSHVMGMLEAKKQSKRQQGRVVDLLHRQHLQEAFELEGRPWKDVPRYEDHVRTNLETGQVPAILQSIVDDDSPVAFDYECNMLKPDSDDAEIVCCSLSIGKFTFAYPMHGPAIRATREFLQSPLPKIAQNVKFEDRWSRAILKTRVRNWDHCTMNTAHVLDNRRGVTGLKFQSFVQLGQSSYDDSIAPYLKAPSSNVPNRIREVDLRDLLLYCGLDSLLTWKIAEKQKEMMG